MQCDKLTCLFFAVLVTTCLFLAVWGTPGVFSLNEETVKITLFYETFCPYCIKFVTEQLYPTTQKLSKHIKLDLVPYGNARKEQIDGQWRFTCQHGVKECYGNKIHACVLEQSTFKSQDSLMDVLNCLMRTSYSDDDISKCLRNGIFSYARVKSCMIESADDLLARYGERTDDNPRVKFVPMLMFNEYSNETLQDKATDNLFDIVCKLFEINVPDVCNDIHNK